VDAAANVFCGIDHALAAVGQLHAHGGDDILAQAIDAHSFAVRPGWAIRHLSSLMTKCVAGQDTSPGTGTGTGKETDSRENDNNRGHGFSSLVRIKSARFGKIRQI
jgi:hypothetical protein